jgi:hypothetical protein
VQKNDELDPQMQSQLGVPLQPAGKGAQLGIIWTPPSSGSVPLHGALQYWSAPQVSLPHAVPALCPAEPAAPPVPALAPPAPAPPPAPPECSHGHASSHAIFTGTQLKPHDASYVLPSIPQTGE